MSNTLHAFEYLKSPRKPASVCVAFGDEAFLRREVTQRLRTDVLGTNEPPDMIFDGPTAFWKDVSAELSTISLFGGGKPRLVVVESADKFVSEYRSKLEDYAAAPRKSSCLVLEVSTWPGNTKLYKALDKSGLQVECKLPTRGKWVDESAIARWLESRAKSKHAIALASGVAEMLLDLVGVQLGLLDQELAKLALFAAKNEKVSLELARKVAGSWSTKSTWDLIDAAVEGRTATALAQLDRLLEAGEHPVALFAQISWSLRRFAAAAQLIDEAEKHGRRVVGQEIMQAAGFRAYPKDAIEKGSAQLRQLGRVRARNLSRWLLDADLALKGSHSQADRGRFVLEQLLLRLSPQLAGIK